MFTRGPNMGGGTFGTKSRGGGKKRKPDGKEPMVYNGDALNPAGISCKREWGGEGPQVKNL